MHLNKFPNSQHSCDSCCNLLGKCQLIQPKLEAPWHPSEVLCQAASLRLHPKSAEPLRNCPQSQYGTPTNHQLNTIVVELLKPLKYLISGSYKFMSCKSAPSQAFLSFSHCAVALHMCCGNQPNLPGTLWPNLRDSDSHSGGSNKQSQTHMPILNWLSHTFFFFILLNHEQTKITNTTVHPLSCKGLFPKPLGNGQTSSQFVPRFAPLDLPMKLSPIRWFGRHWNPFS